jgi:hypothetical protein
MRVRRLIHLVLMTLPIAALAAPAAAQVGGAQNEAGAAVLFEEAKKLLEQKNYDAACQKFLQSYELDRTKPGGLYAHAECLAEAGKVASAVARYREYVRVVDELPPDRRAKHEDRKDRAKEQMTALASDVPELTLVLHSQAPPGTRVTLDGEAIGAEQLDKPRAVDPGEHRVTSEVLGEPPLEERFTLQKGEKRRVVVKVPQPAAKVLKPVNSAPPSPPKTIEGQGTDLSRAGAFAGFGVGAMGLVVGAVTGAIVISKKGAVDNGGCPEDYGDGTRGCTEAGLADAASGQALGTVSTIAFGLGLAGAVTGTIFKLTTGDDASSGERPFSVWRASGYGALGVGGAGLVLGAITGAMALGNAGTVESCNDGSRGGIAVRECSEEAFNAGHGGQALGAVSTGAFIAGAVGLAAGAGLLLLEPSEPERAASRRWVALGPTSLSLERMELGVQGRW